MSALQLCWLAVTIATIIFLVVAAISAMPKMKILRTAIIAVIFVASSGITAFGSFGTLGRRPRPMPAAAVADGSLPPAARARRTAGQAGWPGPVQPAAGARPRRAAGQ